MDQAHKIVGRPVFTPKIKDSIKLLMMILRCIQHVQSDIPKIRKEQISERSFEKITKILNITWWLLQFLQSQ